MGYDLVEDYKEAAEFADDSAMVVFFISVVILGIVSVFLIVWDISGMGDVSRWQIVAILAAFATSFPLCFALVKLRDYYEMMAKTIKRRADLYIHEKEEAAAANAQGLMKERGSQ